MRQRIANVFILYLHRNHKACSVKVAITYYVPVSTQYLPPNYTITKESGLHYEVSTLPSFLPCK